MAEPGEFDFSVRSSDEAAADRSARRRRDLRDPRRSTQIFRSNPDPEVEPEPAPEPELDPVLEPDPHPDPQPQSWPPAPNQFRPTDLDRQGDPRPSHDGRVDPGPSRLHHPGRAADRLRGWIVDRLPDPLKGRWRLDHRVGTALSAVAVVSGMTMGGYALLTAQPQEQPQQFAVTRSADQDHDPNSDHRSGRGSDHNSNHGSDPGGLDGDLPPADPGANAAPAGPWPQTSESPQMAGPAASVDDGIMVDVEGKVTRPGVQRLPPGARVLDAIMMAGGALPGTDLSNLDQARVLSDGEQIMVGPGAGAGPPPGTGPSGPAARSRGKAALTAPVRLNTATLDQLEQLPGVGPALAQRVLDWRTEHGRFSSIDELQQVKGFGPHKFAAVHDLVAL
jgi:competence protein ComEA